MMTSTMTQATWEELLNLDVSDRLLRTAFTDWLEEQGRDQEAQGWRRLVEKGYVPFNWTKWSDTLAPKDRKSNWTLRQNGWVWFHENQEGGNKCGYYSSAEKTRRIQEAKKAMIPDATFRQITIGQDKGAVHFPTPFLAEQALVEALVDSRGGAW